ncbi:hypothetical protein BKA61DRAFT_595999 [Leptodontidium sp. MPI-SDFR-AT-0119]|nr:hypothetical protein BKA61DRAFT_595999 [Leptodontidium sp. MPI-SDFR-AT-0119]
MPLNPHQHITSSSTFSPPEGSWDSHIHIIDPKNYPFPNIGVPRIPHEGTMAGALSNASKPFLEKCVE